MRRLFLFSVAIAAASAPQGALSAKPKTPKLRIEVAQVPSPVPPGQSAEVILTVSAPEGIALNRYPGITLRLGKARGFVPERGEVFVGSKRPLEDPNRFYFEGPVPLRFTVTPDRSVRAPLAAPGTLSFFYCVKKSGYCAPGRQSVEIPLLVTGG